MDRALNDQSAFAARLPIVVGGERRIYDVHALNLGSGSAGIAIDASEATALRAALERMAEAHRRTLDQLSSGVAVFDGQRRLAFYNDSYRRLWDLDRAFLDGNPDDSSVLDRLRAARKLPGAAGFPGLEGQAARGLSRGRAAKRIPGICPTAARSASSPRPIRKAASPICSTTSPKASIWRGGSTA